MAEAEPSATDAAAADAGEPAAADSSVAADGAADAPAAADPPGPGPGEAGPSPGAEASAAPTDPPADPAAAVADGTEAPAIEPPTAVAVDAEAPPVTPPTAAAPETPGSIEVLKPAAAAPPDEAGKQLVTVYADGGTGGTRFKLAKELVPSGVSVKDLGEKRAPLSKLGDSAPTAEDSESAAALMTRRAEFVNAFKDDLTNVALSLSSSNIVRVVVGLTAWYRDLSDEERQAYAGLWQEMENKASDALPGCAFNLHILSGDDEARFEQLAAVHAVKNVLGVDLDCTLSLGNGSIQCSCGEQWGGASSSFSLKLQDGEDMLKADPESFGEWEKTCVGACAEHLAACSDAVGTVSAGSKEGADVALHVLASGASWFAAVAAGLAVEDGAGPSVHSLETALQQLKDTAAKAETEAKARANIVRLYSSLEALFRSETSADLRAACKLVFARSWTINGELFQTTWTSGHFLEAVAEKQKSEAAEEIDAPKPAHEAETAKEDDGEAAPVDGETATGPAASKAEDEFLVAGGPETADDAGVHSPTADAAPAPSAGAVAEDPVKTDGPDVAGESAGAAGESLENPFTLPPSSPQPQKSLEHAKHPMVNSASADSIPRLVVYVVAPAAAAAGEAALSSDEYRWVSAAALRSGAAVVISASSPSSVAALDFEVARTNKILRQVGDFAESRFRAPGVVQAPEIALHALFDALAVDDSGVLSVEAIAMSLRSLGFAGDPVGAAAALAPEGSNRVARADFVKAVAQATEQPTLVAVCPRQDDEAANANDVDAWPAIRPIMVTSGLTGSEALEAKAEEAHRLAGPRSAGGYGVVLVLAARGRQLLPPADYEQHLRQELRTAGEHLPPQWPLLWSPGPAEVGLLTESAARRAVWAMPKTSGSDALASWLRYMLVVRPSR